MKITSTVNLTIILIIISAIFYSLPIIFIQESNHKTILITSFTALLIIFIYGMYKSKDELFNIEPEILFKMMLTCCYKLREISITVLCNNVVYISVAHKSPE